ncbi:Protein of unknown function [Pyronema omphalodes CBS 100304]|uniref:Uncharacterized protein n=1 Tax=Pyronema omphalodes (strain CBS 100304) TaxID=1076935 RepID=U4KY45_PYROM|nr:Protein of unknown function [Pyronema omphalodes CBS 100304]
MHIEAIQEMQGPSGVNSCCWLSPTEQGEDFLQALAVGLMLLQNYRAICICRPENSWMARV